MTVSPMTDAEFAALAAAHGGDLARWPEARRPAAEAALERSAAARGALEEVRALDAALDALAGSPDPVPDAFLARTLGDAAEAARAFAAPPPSPAPSPASSRPRRSPLDALLGAVLRPAAFAASVAAGFALAYAAPETTALTMLDAALGSSAERALLGQELLPDLDLPAELETN